MPMNSCFKCADRRAGCHSECAKYAEWKAEEQSRKGAELRAKAARCEIDDYIKNGRDRARRRLGRK